MMDYHRQDRVDIRIARIFNTYGPRMAENDGRVVSNFIVQALRGQELTLYGTGEQTRSFCYVDDLVDGLIRLMAAEGRHEPVNLGNPVEFTIRSWPSEVMPDRRRRGADHLPAAAAGRPDPAPAGHHPRPRVARLGAASPARGGAGQDRGVLPRPARAEGSPQSATMAGTSTEAVSRGLARSCDHRPRRGPASQPPPPRRFSFRRFAVWANAEREDRPMTTPPLASPLAPARRRSRLGLACARNPVTGKNELSLVSESQEIQMGKQAAQEVAQTIGSGQRRPAGLRLRHRHEDGQGVRAAQPALGVPRGERRLGQRLRAAGRVHLRDPRPDHQHQRRGRAGHGRGPRDRPRHQPAFGAADQQGAAGPARARARQHPLARHRPVRRASPARASSVLFLKYSRDAENQADQAGLPLRAEPELRRAGDGQRVPDARAGEQRGRRRASCPSGSRPTPIRATGYSTPRQRLDTLPRT